MAKKAAVSEVRAWAKDHGFELGDRGRLPAEVWAAWESHEANRPVPRQRPEAPQPSAVSVEDFQAARATIAGLEKQLAELTGRVTELEGKAKERRRRFARSR